MVVSQRKFRELVFQMIFSRDLNAETDCKKIALLLDHLMITKKVMQEVCMRVQRVVGLFDEIDVFISNFSTDYDFKRISRVEKNILRLGIFELLYDEEIPFKVAISEAVRLSRKFGTPESGNFINGVLDKIYQTKVQDESCP